MRILLGSRRAPAPAKERTVAGENLQVNSGEIPPADMERVTAPSAPVRAAAANEIGLPHYNNVPRAEEHVQGHSSSLGDTSSAFCIVSVTEGEALPMSSPRNRAERSGRKSVARLGPRALSSQKPLFHMKSSTSSLSLSKKDLIRNSSGTTLGGTAETSWLKKGKLRLAKIFCYTGRLGLNVYPISLEFRDREVESDWHAMRAEHGAKAFLWLGAIIVVQICLDLIDHAVGAIPLNTIDGELVMLPTWLTCPLPFVLFTLACTKWGRQHSTTCLTVAFFLYSPLFLLYSSRSRTQRITEFFLGRPLDFDFSLYARRDTIISASQPILLVIAAYAVAVPFIWALLFCLWVVLWWITVSAVLPPSKKQQALGHWFFLTLSGLLFLLVTSLTIRSAVLASRHRFSMMRQAEKDLAGIRQQAAALVAHSALGHLFHHIADAESSLREAKLASPQDLSQMEGLISRVLVCLVQAQICLSHLDDQRSVDPLSGSVNAWAVTRSSGEIPTKAASAFSGRDMLNSKENASSSRMRSHVPPSEGFESRRTSVQKHHYATSSDSSNTPPTLREDATATQFRKRSGDFLILGRRSSLSNIQSMEIATVDPKRRSKCGQFIKELVEQLIQMPVAAADGEQREAGDSQHFGNQSSSGRKRSLAKTTFREPSELLQFEEAPSRGVVSESILTLVAQVGKEWDMDVFLLSKLSRHNVLPTVGFQLRRAFLDSAEAIKVDDSKWSTFLREICIRYRKTPYHNERHAGTVAHLNVWLLRHTACWNPLTPSQKLAVVVAALVHDVGHFGVNNSLLINSNHPLAVTYNDRAVLENFHASVAFRTILFYSNGAANIFEHLSVEQYKAERAAIVELVLETDLASHFDFLTRFRLKMQVIKATVARLANAETMDEDAEKTLGEDASADCWMVARAAIRCADIGHSAVNWEQHYRWSRALMREFFCQGRQEAELGIPVSPVCDEANADVPKSQVGFIRLICQPLFEALDQADSSGSIVAVCLRRIRSNSATWKRVSDTGINWKDAEDVARQDSPLVPMKFTAPS